MPEIICKRQCSEEEEFLLSELKLAQDSQKQRPQSAPPTNFDELLEKLKVLLVV